MSVYAIFLAYAKRLFLGHLVTVSLLKPSEGFLLVFRLCNVKIWIV